MQDGKKVNYGNWVSKRMMKLLVTVLLICIGLTVVSFCSFTESWTALTKGIFHAIVLIMTFTILILIVYLCICKGLFSYEGKHKIQNKILDYVLSYLEFDKGQILDIGCGNGALSIKTAKKFPKSHIIAIDYWGPVWNFGKEQCEINGKLEGVEDRSTFQKGDAAKLDFKNEQFDGAVSNFVFHEVKSQTNKQLVVREALRVVKKGGVFAFHDLFLEEKLYGDIEGFIEELRKEGISKINLVYTADKKFIPGILKTRFMLGRIALIYGIK